MFCVNVFLNVKDPGDIEAVKAMLTQCGRLSRAEAGCLQFDVCHVRDNPQTFILCERWASELAWQEHKECEAVQTIYLPKVLPLVERTPYICDVLE